MHIQKKVFTPIQIGPITLKHRVVMPPMSRLRTQWPSSIPSDLQLEYYRQRASDGGLIFTEATAISTSGRGYKGAPGLYSDEQVAKIILDREFRLQIKELDGEVHDYGRKLDGRYCWIDHSAFADTGTGAQ